MMGNGIKLATVVSTSATPKPTSMRREPFLQAWVQQVEAFCGSWLPLIAVADWGGTGWKLILFCFFLQVIRLYAFCKALLINLSMINSLILNFLRFGVFIDCSGLEPLYCLFYKAWRLDVICLDESWSCDVICNAVKRGAACLLIHIIASLSYCCNQIASC